MNKHFCEIRCFAVGKQNSDIKDIADDSDARNCLLESVEKIFIYIDLN